ncbi:MAG TPA: M14 metallopeptidase family protein [Candidatus Angelobacter sp.]|nr:M14 metallopeptidase family protein [Candidatus Angelobacter sp.]
MHKQKSAAFSLALFLFAAVMPVAAQKSSHIPTPSEVLGFEVGADRKLADYRQISGYFKALSAASDRVQIQVLGKTTLGEEMFMAVISTPENLRNKARYQEIARKLADPRGLSTDQIDALAREGKAIFLLTCNIHSTEIGSSQMAMEWAHKLATAADPETLRRLNDVIILLVPSLNPDGETMVTEWYRKYLGTKYEGGAMPYLYHHYVGHDNNRDWYMLTQVETRNVNQAVYHEWFPQFWLDEHQMGSYGPRIYIPPNADPVAKLVNPLVHRGNNLVGAAMGWRLEEAGKPGVIYNYSFDAYWPGGTRNTGWWKNMYGVLTEVASARIATPMQISPTELQGGTKGLINYQQQINFPNPWPGGAWRLRDIMDYELLVSDAALETMSKYRRELLRGVASMAEEAVNSADPNEYWRIPLEGQRDPVEAIRLKDLMWKHGVQVLRSGDGKTYLIPTAQPYGRFVEEMMGIQRYPEVHPAQGSGILEPYDVAAWSLPLMMGVKVEKARLTKAEQAEAKVPKVTIGDVESGLSGPGRYYAIPLQQNMVFSLINAMEKAGKQVFLANAPGKLPEVIFSDPPQDTPTPPGTSEWDKVLSSNKVLAAHRQLAAAAFEKELALYPLADLPKGALQLKRPRVGLYKSYVPSIDEGWTRFVLEQYGFDVKNIENKQMRAGNLNAAFDTIILPDSSREVIVEGRQGREGYSEELPPEYTGGIGKEGVKALKDFVDKGGTLITLARASEVVMGEEFNLPVRNALAGAGGRPLPQSDFNIPGSLLRVYVDQQHPVGYGMPKEVAAFVDAPLAFQTSSPGPDTQRSVIAWYPDDAKDMLLSGYAHGAERLERKAAAVSFTRGKGHVVMFGFRVQHRAQTEGTFQMLFNAIEWAGME